MIVIPCAPIPISASPLLLDTLSATAFAAFSTRKLRSAYAGSALKVTTSAGGNATQDIGFVSNNLDTAALATFIGSNSGSIDTWYDQSLAATNSNNATISRQPIIVNSGTNVMQNSHVCWQETNAFTRWLDWHPSASSQPFSFAIAFKYSSANAFALLANQTAGPINIATFSTQYFIGAGSTIAGGTIDTSVHMAICIFNGGSSSYIIDGATVASGNAGANTINGTDNFTIGTDTAFNTQDLTVCEFLYFPNIALGSPDQAIIRSSWQSYWGTP